MTADPDTLDRLRLARSEGVGPVVYRRLIARFGTPGAALAALPALARRGGRAEPPRIPGRAEAERELRALRRLGARLIALGDPDYPPALAAIEDAPPVFTLRGRAELLTRPAVGIVGARNASLNGRRFAERLARELGEAGLVVVSGLARGIDAAAHAGALATGTIAALAGGLDHVYPPENAALHARIGTEGALIAEAPPGTVPTSRMFPRRNRIVSGLALGVIVVEAASRSGSLITARRAAEQGRLVFAVPGSPVDPRSEGSNQLIRDGATLVFEAAHVVEALAPLVPASHGLQPPPPMLPDEDRLPPEMPGAEAHAAVLAHLSVDPTAVDELMRDVQLSPPSLQAVLLELELAGRIDRLPGNRVALSAPGESA